MRDRDMILVELPHAKRRPHTGARDIRECAAVDRLVRVFDTAMTQRDLIHQRIGITEITHCFQCKKTGNIPGSVTAHPVCDRCYHSGRGFHLENQERVLIHRTDIAHMR